MQISQARKVLVPQVMQRLMMAIAIVGMLGRFAAAERIAATDADRATVERVLADVASARHTDVGISGLELAPDGEDMVVRAEVRVAVSDDDGRIVSVVSGAAKVCVPAASYRDAHLARMRTEALLAATAAVAPKLRAVAPPRGLVDRLASWFARLAPRRLS